MKQTFCAVLLALSIAVASIANQPVRTQDNKRGIDLEQAGQPPQQRESRVALVIGNKSYEHSPLTNPVNDAKAMADALRDKGFDVLYGADLSQNDMKRIIDNFGEKIRNGGVGLFYYSGHGIQIKGRNYLIPVSARITSEDDVEYESVDVGRVLAKMDAAHNRLNIVVLDACRNNPFARSFRSMNQGLASIDAPSGTLIAYATSPGSVASDGAGANGLYTQQLLNYMRTPGLSIEQVFKQVRIAVMDQSKGKQTPWESSSLVGEFYFTGPLPASNTVKSLATPAVVPSRPASPLDAVLNKYVEALGGNDAIQRLTSRVAKGTIENSTEGISGTFEYYEKAPNKSFLLINYPGLGSISGGYDGRVGWSRNSEGVRDMSGLELVQKRRDSDFYRDLKLGQLQVELSLRDKVRIGERDFNLVEAITPEGGVEKWYFDSQTGLRVRRDIENENPQNRRTLERYYEDYREVNGIKWPFTMRDQSTSESITYKFEEVKFNVAIDGTIFKKPDGNASGDALLYEKGNKLASEGKWAEAESVYKETVSVQPRFAPAHYALGAAMLAQGRFAAAETEFREAIKLSPNNRMSELFHFGLGEALRSQQKLLEAEHEYAEAAKFAGKHYVMGMSLLVEDRFPEAEIEFRQAIRLGPSNPTIGSFHFELGEALEKQHKLTEAEREYAEAVRLNPNDERFRHRLDGIRKTTASESKTTTQPTDTEAHSDSPSWKYSPVPDSSPSTGSSAGVPLPAVSFREMIVERAGRFKLVDIKQADAVLLEKGLEGVSANYTANGLGIVFHMIIRHSSPEAANRALQAQSTKYGLRIVRREPAYNQRNERVGNKIFLRSPDTAQDYAYWTDGSFLLIAESRPGYAGLAEEFAKSIPY